MIRSINSSFTPRTDRYRKMTKPQLQQEAIKLNKQLEKQKFYTESSYLGLFSVFAMVNALWYWAWSNAWSKLNQAGIYI